MVTDLPSLDLVYEETLRAVDAQARQAELIDARAGLVLGFAGVLAGLSLDSVDASHRLVAVPAAVAALLALATVVTRPFPGVRARALRDRYLASDPRVVRLRLIDVRIDLLSRSGRVLDRKAATLRLASGVLALSVVLAVVAAIVDVPGR